MTLTEQVQKYLAHVPQPVKAKSYLVCRDMAMGENTFRRKLRAEGESYQHLLNNEMLIRAQGMRRQGYKHHEIAEELGYSHPQNLGRFLRVNG